MFEVDKTLFRCS
jgi:hypothetical protein